MFRNLGKRFKGVVSYGMGGKFVLYALPFKCVLSLESQHTIDFCGRLQLGRVSCCFYTYQLRCQMDRRYCLHGGPRQRGFLLNRFTTVIYAAVIQTIIMQANLI